jgi:hypothetical protein
MNDKKTHGGKRKGAGRKPNWSFDDVIRIGQACEVHFRAVVHAEFEKRKNELISNDVTDLEDLFQNAQSIHVEDRQEWLTDENGGAQHLADVEEELATLNATMEGTDPKNRVFQIVGKAPKGTRSRIIKIVAEEYGLKAKQVDNLWQRYRRLEREP